MLEIYQSNQVEKLVEALINLLKAPREDSEEDLRPECIAVQSHGMETWLSMEISKDKEMGIFANGEFPFPKKLIHKLISIIVDDKSIGTSTGTLTWSVMKRLGGLAHTEIKSYIEDDPAGLKRYQLAKRIAGLFDNYSVYRPKMTAAGADEKSWQYDLWRTLVKDDKFTPISDPMEDFMQEIGSVIRDKLPSRISIFGVSMLPPIYLEILSKVSKHIQVNLFLFSPSKKHADFVASQVADYKYADLINTSTGKLDQILDSADGNPLLDSLGSQGRCFQALLKTASPENIKINNCYDEAEGGSLLNRMQRGVMNQDLWNEGGCDLEIEKSDHSLTIHSCHSMMREAEVLHDRLLALFDNDDTLQPDDIIVMTPDIELYAPYIDAAFSASEGKSAPIPFRISDRRIRRTTPMTEALLNILSLIKSRLTVQQVFDLLMVEAIRENFNLTPDEIETVRDWVEAAGIRWGIDEKHRSSFDQGGFDENTWRFGLNRLLLGYALPDEEERLFEDVLPYNEIEGKESELLGRFASYCETLFKHIEKLKAPRIIKDWKADLDFLLKDMTFQDDRVFHQYQLIMSKLKDLERESNESGFDEEPVSLEVVKALLADAFNESEPARGFLSFGVSFCNLLPMRSIPFRVICLMGIDYDKFPRTRSAVGFDLMAQDPKVGDRSSREDDRYLFLEAIFSAREQLIISYIGQSMADNSRIPPSVVVSELIDLVSDSTGQKREDVFNRLVTEHPLQPFSPRCFGVTDNPELFSYSKEFYEGASSYLAPIEDDAPFFTAEVDITTGVPPVVTLDELVRFFKLPAKYFLEKILGVYVDEEEIETQDREPIDLTPLQNYSVKSDFMDRAIEKDGLDGYRNLAMARGDLPLGELGELTYDRTVELEINPVLKQLNDLQKDAQLPPVNIDIPYDDKTRLVGEVSKIWPACRIDYTCGKITPKKRFELWINHLALNTIDNDGYPRTSILVAKDNESLKFKSIDTDAKNLLMKLVELYLIGLKRPLYFFPEASMAYMIKIKSEEEAILSAAKAWNRPGGFNAPPGEGMKNSTRLLFRGIDPLNDESPPFELTFKGIIETVVKPMLEHEIK